MQIADGSTATQRDLRTWAQTTNANVRADEKTTNKWQYSARCSGSAFGRIVDTRNSPAAHARTHAGTRMRTHTQSQPPLNHWPAGPATIGRSRLPKKCGQASGRAHWRMLQTEPALHAQLPKVPKWSVPVARPQRTFGRVAGPPRPGLAQ